LLVAVAAVGVVGVVNRVELWSRYVKVGVKLVACASTTYYETILEHAARSGRTVGTVMFFQSFVFCFPINNDFFSVFFSVFFFF
jgi:hypothetical protein